MTGKWKPKNEDRYYYVAIAQDNHVHWCHYSGKNYFCQSDVRIGNCFKTKAEAERKRKEILKVLEAR